MQCLSCKQETPAAQAKVVLKMFVCQGCAELIRAAVSALEAAHENARQTAYDVLTQHVMKGGLLRVEPHFGEGEK